MNVAIVIPTHKGKPSRFECVSLERCLNVLGSYPIRIVCPIDADMSFYEQFESDSVRIVRVPKMWLSSIQAYNKFKTSLYFYHLFSEFEYVLTYELDAYVFHDELSDWCDAGFDYIGAPWFDGFHRGRSLKFSGVGNSGFSLRRVSSCIRVLHSFSVIESPSQVADRLTRNLKSRRWKAAARELRRLTLGNNTHYLMNDFHRHEDVFWGKIAPEKFDWFKVAPAEVALKFSFEVNPRYLYEMNGNKLPFGCHGWAKFDLAFWRQFMATEVLKAESKCAVAGKS